MRWIVTQVDVARGAPNVCVFGNGISLRSLSQNRGGQTKRAHTVIVPGRAKQEIGSHSAQGAFLERQALDTRGRSVRRRRGELSRGAAHVVSVGGICLVLLPTRAA